MEHRQSPFIIRIFQFLGKVQFTMILLLLGVVVMTVGTIIESRESREVAQSVIYGTFWFDTFLFLIGLNLVIAVINRIPIQRHQWAFVLVHFSIVILLIGSWVSHNFGYEGRAMIYEGSSSSQLFLDVKQLRVGWEGGETIFPLKAGRDLTGKILQEEEGARPGIRVLKDLPRGTQKVKMAEGRVQDPPGIRFIISGEKQYVNDWEIASGWRPKVRNTGDFEVEVVPVTSQSDLEDRMKAKRSAGYRVIVQVRENSKPVEISLPEGLGKDVSLGDGMVAKVESYFINARLIKGKLEDVPSAATNPAVVVEIRSASGSERHTLFSKFPDFNVIHNRNSDQKLVEQLAFIGEDSFVKPRISVLVGPEEQLHVQLTTGTGIEVAVPLTVKESIPLELIGVDFELTERLLHARPDLNVRPVPQGWQGGENSYLQIEVSAQGSSESFWLGFGATERIELAGKRVDFIFGEEIRTLPFTIALNEFEVVNYPGSTRPAQYQSQITITSSAPGSLPRPEMISMNRPLDEQGFRLFQSSYRLGEGDRGLQLLLSPDLHTVEVG